MSSARHAFTLIELLVVVAIVAVLAAFLFPAFVRAKAAAKRKACLSDLRQTGTALTLYAADADDVLPDNGSIQPGVGRELGFLDPAAEPSWARAALPYVARGVLICPATSPRTAGGLNNAATLAGAGNTSDLLNGIVDGKSLSVWPSPSDTILLHELAEYTRASQIRPAHPAFLKDGVKDRSTVEWQLFAHPLYDVAHGEGGNLVFGDLHARYLRRAAMTYAMFGCPPELNLEMPTNLPPAGDSALALERYRTDRFTSSF